jgi:nicotinamide mononucleotide transporter
MMYSKWTRFEKVWVTIFSVLILAATLYFSATAPTKDFWSWALNWIVSPISAVTGVLCVVLCAKGKLSNWSWGLVNSITYGLVAWVGGYYGDWLLNWFYFIPTQLLIYFGWRNRIRFGVVQLRRISPAMGFGVFLLAMVATVLFAEFLTHVDGWFTQALERSSTFYKNIDAIISIPSPGIGPLLDSASVVLQVIAEVLLILRLKHQWPLWIATNVISIFIWTVVLVTDPSSSAFAAPTLLMWVAFLANSVYGTHVWYKEERA